MEKFVATVASLWQEFIIYAQLAEYRQGLFVEISGTLIEVFFLIFAVRAALWLMNRAKHRQNTFLTSFFDAQFCRESFLLLLRTGGVTDVSAELKVALERGKLDALFSHMYYGNTENLRDLLQLRLGSKAYFSGHIGLKNNVLVDLSVEADKMISKIDQSILLCAALDQQERSMQLYELRIAFFALRDYLKHEASQRSSSGRSDVLLLTDRLCALLSSQLASDKRNLDAHLRRALRKYMIILIVKLPFLLAHRFFGRVWAKIRKIVYLSPYSTNFFSVFLRLVIKRSGMDIPTAAAKAGVSQQLMESYFLGHKRPQHENQRAILLALRKELPPLEWNQLLMSTVLRDIEHQRPSPVVVDAVKANASYWLATLANGNEADADQIAELLMRLVFMGPMRW